MELLTRLCLRFDGDFTLTMQQRTSPKDTPLTDIATNTIPGLKYNKYTLVYHMTQ